MQLGKLERAARNVFQRIAVPFARRPVATAQTDVDSQPDSESWSDTYKGFRIVLAARCDNKPYRGWFTVTLKHRDGRSETIALEQLPEKYASDLEAKAAALLAAQALIDSIEVKRSDRRGRSNG